MESGLLSSFHDDHYDGNYSKYDNNLGIWSDGNEYGYNIPSTIDMFHWSHSSVMGLQLSETLHGILPITANEEATHFFETDIEHRIPYRFQSENDGLNETIIEMDKNEDEDYLLTSYDVADDMSDSMSPSIEIISVDPNGEFNSPVTIDDDEEDNQQTDSERCSSRSSDCSSNSSIADYESHSSDESEEDIEKSVVNAEFIKPEVRQLIKIEEAFDYTTTPKKKESSLKNVSHCVQKTKKSHKTLPVENRVIDKPLETEVADIKNFDLTAYITQDNYDFLNTYVSDVKDAKDKRPSDGVKNCSSNFEAINVVNIKTEPKCDSDTEVIVDIETVHDNEEGAKPMLLRKQTVDYSSCMDIGEIVNHCDDDIKHDPSWSPNNEKTTKVSKPRVNRQLKTRKSNNLSNRILNSSSTSTNGTRKPHIIMDRKKYGLGKGKNISMCTRPETSDSSDDSDEANINDKEKANSLLNRNTEEIKLNCAIDNKLKIKIKTPQCNSVGNSLAKRIETNIPASRIPVSNIEKDTKSVQDQKIVVKIEPEIQSTIQSNKCNDENVQNQAILDADKAPAAVNTQPKQAEPVPIVPIKKKLNLEEYKRRRENQLIGDTKIKKTIPCNPIPLAVGNKNHKEEPKKQNVGPKQSIPIVNNKNLPQPMYMENGKEFFDPILEAKKKVLRMQELKKVAQSKRIDSTVSAKVGPIMPILPMEQICGYKAQNDGTNKMNPEYEEIIIVSASCNTEITLPPVFEKLDAALVRNDSPLSAVIKSSSLLSNINNTITKTSVVKISSNSLLSSIQDVVLKQSTTTLLNGNQPPQKSPNIGVSPPSQFSPQKPEMSNTDKANPDTTNDNPTHAGKELEHGEDKIIMHLRKDRIRKKTFSIAIQTDDLPQFPPLPLISLSDKYCQSANTKKRKRHYRSRRDSSASSVDNDDYRSSSRSHLRYRSVSSHGTNRSISPRSSRYSYSSGHRTASPYHKVRRRSSRSSSRTKYVSDSSDSGRRSRSRERRTRRYSSSHSSSSSSGSSDSSSRSRSRSRSATSRSRSRSRYSSVNQRRLSNYQRRTSSPGNAVEERRIVYVGRIERETSKEDLKRKFIAYGPIKQITVHYKDTGMKYGFVTFEKAQDAFTVIDGSAKDPRINMYDISFGGRRAFCRANYSDLDGAATNSLQDLPYPIAPRSVPFEEDSFESLLAKVKEKLSSARPASSPAPSTGSSRCKT